MTDLTLAARNLLAQDHQLRKLLGRSASWDTWVFSEEPFANFEGSGKCLIVINENGTWTAPNAHNTLSFPKLTVDVWADPTRNPDKSVRVQDAKAKIVDIGKLLSRHFHLVDMGTRTGMPYIWGTAEEIANKTGVVISGSQFLNGPTFAQVRDAQGAWMGSFDYGVNVL